MFRKGDLFDYNDTTYEVKEAYGEKSIPFTWVYKVLNIGTGHTGGIHHSDDMLLTEEPYQNPLEEKRYHSEDFPDKDQYFDNVSRPKHYNLDEGGIECIDYIESFLSNEEYQGYLRGNVAKYLHRYKYKNGIEDLHKAQWYLSRLEKLEKKLTP